MDDTALKQICESIYYDHNDPNFVVMDQIYTVQSIINRTAFYLGHPQMEYLNKKYKNLYKQRMDWKEAQQKVKQNIKQVQQPQLNQSRRQTEAVNPNPRFEELEE